MNTVSFHLGLALAKLTFKPLSWCDTLLHSLVFLKALQALFQPEHPVFVALVTGNPDGHFPQSQSEAEGLRTGPTPSRGLQ
jgi:hypothetical protein